MTNETPEEAEKRAFEKATNRAFRQAMSNGVFPDWEPCGKDEGELPEPHNKPDEVDLEMGIVTTKIAGTTNLISAKDYPMAWKNREEKKKPSTTHELCFDECNGFDEDFLYASGMTKSRIARVSKKNPMRQTVFIFKEPPSSMKDKGLPIGKAEPHTLKFANVEVKKESEKGILWVGLENWGIIVSLHMPNIMEKYNAKIDATGDNIQEPQEVILDPEDYGTVLDVRIHGDNGSTPIPINTRPHAFCFDANYEQVYFAGKLTNTVGRIKLDGTSLQHFMIPTLGAIPIYVALGPDDNVWGTCLNTGFIFRCTTGDNPTVIEIPIDEFGKSRRPIAIVADPRPKNKKDPNSPKMQFMWFSTEGGHSICRLDTKQFEKQWASQNKDGSKESYCVCSSGCQWLFNKGAFHRRPDIITEFPVPKMNHNMKLGGLAVTKKGEIWTQSYMGDNKEGLPDYIIKLNFNVHYPTNTHDASRKKLGSSVTGMTGLPIDFYELPTKNTILHRIKCDPDDQVWFTELAADRIGTIHIGPKEDSSNRKHETEMTENPVQKKQKQESSCCD